QQVREQLPELRFVLDQGLVEQAVPVGVQSTGMVPGFPDIQADDDRESCVHDAVLPWSINAGRSLDTRCRHPRYKETSAVLGRVPISGKRVSLDQAATPPGPLMAGQQSHTRPSDQTPGYRGHSQGNGRLVTALSFDRETPVLVTAVVTMPHLSGRDLPRRSSRPVARSTRSSLTARRQRRRRCMWRRSLLSSWSAAAAPAGSG